MREGSWRAGRSGGEKDTGTALRHWPREREDRAERTANRARSLTRFEAPSRARSEGRQPGSVVGGPGAESNGGVVAQKGRAVE